MMDINVILLQWSIKFLIKNFWWGHTIAIKSAIKNENISNKELAKELQKPIIRKFKKRKVYSTFIDNILGADLADMQLIIKFNKGFRFLLCVIDIYSKRVVPSKDKKGITITNAFQKFLDELKRKPNKIWVNKGSKFYNRSMKSWLEKTDIEIIMKENLLLLKDSLGP